MRRKKEVVTEGSDLEFGNTMGALELASISAEQRRQYKSYLEAFKLFCKDQNLGWPGGMGDRRDTLGLLRRLVPGRKEFSYRREDTGSGRVHVPAAQGQVDEGTEISKGVEEDRPTSQQASPSSSGSMWDSSNPFSQRTAEDGLEGDDRLRLLSSTRRRDGHTRKACREAVEKCRPTISTVLPSDQRSGRRCTRQDRHFRQHSSFRQPSDEELVGASIGKACSDIGEDQSDFRLQARPISGGIPKSGRDPGFEQPPHLSAPPWRGQRRLELEAEGPSCGPRKREMANGCQRTSLRQVREDSKAAARSSEGQVGFLQMGGTQHGEHGDRKNSCKNSMSGSWRDCREPFVLEVFAGSGRLTSTLKELGINAHALDILTDPLDDVLSPKVKFKIFDLVKRGIILFVWIGMPCTTFSVARRHDGVGPPPLRSDAQPMGLDFLRPHDKKKLKEGNALLLFTYELALCCMRYGVPWAIENPASSRCWLTPCSKSWPSMVHLFILIFASFMNPGRNRPLFYIMESIFPALVNVALVENFARVQAKITLS